MHYEINVTLKGRHYFATAKRSLDTEFKANEMFAIFCAKFPKAEGYEISLSRVETIGYQMVSTK